MRRFALLVWYGIGLAFAWAFKSFYSHAGADDLDWILAPTCRLAGLVSGIDFQQEAGAGWITHTHRMIVGAGCAGGNFLIISFLTLFCSTVYRVRSPAARALCLVGSVFGAWALTITTNATRIVLVVSLYPMDIYGDVVTPDRVHRAAGTIIYILSLVLVYLAVDRLLQRAQDHGTVRRAPSALVPVAWYLGVTIGLPLLNRAWRDDPGRFLEHSAFVVLICTLVAVAGAAHGWHRRAAGRTLSEDA